MVSRTLLMILLAAWLVACTTPAPTPEPVPLPSPPPGGGATVHPGAGLVVQARQAREAGELERAQILLQRAQRIDPRNPRVYVELARLYADRGDSVESQIMAERGLLYCERATCSTLRQFIRD